MSEMLFKCPDCSKSLAVDMSRIGSRVPCTDCEARLKVPKPGIAFYCDECKSYYQSPTKDVGSVFTCPECRADITVPATSHHDPAEGSDIQDKPLFEERPNAEKPRRYNPAFARLLMSVMLITVMAFLAWYFLEAIQKGSKKVSDVFLLLQTQPPQQEPAIAVVKPAPGQKEIAKISPPAVTEAVSEKKKEPEIIAVSSGPTPPPEDQEANSEVEFKELSTLRDIYEKSQKDQKREYALRISKLPGGYIKALRELQEKLQNSGDLDGWLAAEKEIDRFEAQKRIRPRDLVATTPPIKALQMKYQSAEKDCQDNKADKTMFLSKSYVERLNILKKKLTQEGNIRYALLIHSEINRVQSSPDIMAAEFSLAERASQPKAKKTPLSPPQKKITPPPVVVTKPITIEAKPITIVKMPVKQTQKIEKPVKPTPVIKAQPVRLPSTKMGQVNEDKPVIYENILPPVLPDIDFVKLTMKATSKTLFRDDKIKTDIMLGSQISVSSAENKGPDLTLKVRECANQYRVRIAIKTAHRRFSFNEPVVVVQYYSEGKGGQRAVPRQIARDYIKLKKLYEDWIFIDCPEVSTKQSLSSFSTGGYKRMTESGSDIQGVIISIFQSDGKLIYQESSSVALKNLGILGLPAEARMAQ